MAAHNPLVKEALRRVSDQLQDLVPQFVRWDQTSLVQALMDAQRVLSKYLPHSCSRVDAIKLVPGTKQSIDVVPANRILNGDGTTSVESHGNRLLEGTVRNMGANGTTPGRSVRPVPGVVLDQSDPTWHTKTASVVTQIVYNPQTPKVFYVSPGVPASPDVWLEMPWLPDPTEISTAGDYTAASADTTRLSVDNKYLDDIVNYVMARAYMKDAEFIGSAALANSYSAMFVASINLQAVAMGLPDPKLRTLPIPGAG